MASRKRWITPLTSSTIQPARNTPALTPPFVSERDTPPPLFITLNHAPNPPPHAYSSASTSVTPPPVMAWQLRPGATLGSNEEETLMSDPSVTNSPTLERRPPWPYLVQNSTTPSHLSTSTTSQAIPLQRHQSLSTSQNAVSWPIRSLSAPPLIPSFLQGCDLEFRPSRRSSIPVEFPSEVLNSGSAQVLSSHPEEKDPASLYKTELCRSFMENGSCRYGFKCQFAHGTAELRPVQRHPRYKTEICKTFHTIGTCKYGTRCRFIHMKPTAEPFVLRDPDGTLKEDKPTHPQPPPLNVPSTAAVSSTQTGDPPVDGRRPGRASSSSRLEVFRHLTSS
ncbi:CCCH-type Zn-finger protein [Pelomyxa schiedti]|nr:CCCH-type Zn-finger protein [Pelomyxa schiedti]